MEYSKCGGHIRSVRGWGRCAVSSEKLWLLDVVRLWPWMLDESECHCDDDVEEGEGPSPPGHQPEFDGYG